MATHPLDRVFIFGGSGSGTTTLGAALALHLGHPHFDTDDFFWLPTDPPFTQTRPAAERDALMTEAFDGHPRYVLSGSMSNFGQVFFPRFTLAIWMTLPHDLRMARLDARQRARFGDAIESGGTMAEQHRDFMAWASQYDTGGLNMRSYAVHEALFDEFPCQALKLEGNMTTNVQVEEVLRFCNQPGTTKDMGQPKT